MEDKNPLATFALASAVLLSTLVALTLAWGLSQQSLEWFLAPDAYATALVDNAMPLRVIIGIDDLFIAAYVTTTLLFAMRLAEGRWTPLHILIVVFGVTAGVLDLEENHHILTMLRVAENGIAIPAYEILHRSVLSQMKWMLGSFAFLFIGVVMPARDFVSRAFRFSLLFVQLPIGALAWIAPSDSQPILWLRYVSVIAGFATVAWLARRASLSHADVDEGVTGAPA